MSQSCIVCLGDLCEIDHALPHTSSESIPAEQVEALKAEDVHSQKNLVSLRESNVDSEMIAKLIPCGHCLHDECLKPWVERANSCPICRQIFNQVEVSNEIGGETLVTVLTATSVSNSSSRACHFLIHSRKPYPRRGV